MSIDTQVLAIFRPDTALRACLDRTECLGHHPRHMQTRDANSPAIVLSAVQKLRKPLLVFAVVLLGLGYVFVGSKWPDGHLPHEIIEWCGRALIIACILGRTWSSFYISGRKDVALVMTGPYSICRNPLYFFSVLGAIGVGAQLGSIVSAVVIGFLVWALFQLVILEEEKMLETVYGRAYMEYCGQVPRLLPRPSLWHGNDVVEVHVNRVARTFVDACVFLLAIPAAEAVGFLQESGIIPVLFRLP
ncbi:MAG: methyltransferase family protein [Xanthobacteraceae bacterium]